MMEENFDAEFKRKVKKINPEIPDLVRMRISDTLASLLKRRSWRKSGYLSAMAALFLLSFVGIRYIYPMQSAKNAAPEAAQSPTIAAADALESYNKQAKADFTMEANADGNKTAENNTVENNTGDSTKAMLQQAPEPKNARNNDESKGANYGIASDTKNIELPLTGNDGKTAADQGIQLILKTAIYDGKEIRIEFDKNSTRGAVLIASAKQETDMTSNDKANNILKSAQVNVAKDYDVRIVVNNIPLKCSINVVETPQGENQYSGTMIIIPDSGLPEKFDMILSFDKIGDTSGQWLLTSQVSKQ